MMKTINRWMDGWTDRWTDTRTDRLVDQPDRKRETEEIN